MFCIEQYKQQTDTLCVLHLILIYSNALAIICRQAGRQGEGEKDRERERERERERAIESIIATADHLTFIYNLFL